MIEDILLRSAVNPPLTTKGSQLTWEELDGNFIEIFNAFIANYLSSYVDAYDNATTYDDTIKNYVVYDSVIWKFINVTPAVGQTPSASPLYWQRVWAADLAHKKNSDTILAEGTADEVSASDLALIVNNAPVIYSYSGIVTSAEILSLFSTPVEILPFPAGAEYVGKRIKIINSEIENLIELSPASTLYVTNQTLQLRTDTATQEQQQFSSILNASIARCLSGLRVAVTGAADTQLIAEKGIVIESLTGDTTLGDYDISVTFNYIFI